MMLFDNSSSDSIPLVIVPPKPDASLSCGQEFSYSNLYPGCDASTATATTAATSGSAGSNESGGSSSSTLASSPSANNERTVSFDAGAFDNARRNNSSSSTSSAAGPTLRSTAITRDPRNGAFTFQVHAEYDLLMCIQKELDKQRRAAGGSNALSDVQLSKIIMRSVDEYCLRKQWMYHIGSEKAVAIGRFLREAAELYMKNNAGTGSNGEVKKFICVDLGTYCGYSAIVLASTLRQLLQEQQTSSGQPFEFHIYTTEVSSKLLNVAQSVFRLAKMDAYITPILVKSESQEPLSQTLKKHGVSNIDFLLLDHAKNLYLNDLQDMEDNKLLSAGSHVSADNVVYNRLDSYRQHMHKLTLQRVVESRLEEMNLEYSNNLKDGIEMTVYLKDPPAN